MANNNGEAAVSSVDEAQRLRTELEAARAEIARLQEDLLKEKSRRRPDLVQSLQQLRQGTFERLGWTSNAKARFHLTKLLKQGLPEGRKREAWAVSMLFLLLPFCTFLTASVIFACVYYRLLLLTALVLIYFGHIVQDGSYEDGGKPSRRLKTHAFWGHVTKYFPVELRKMNPDTSFPTDVVYMFGYHPHGVWGIGCFLNFLTTATGLDELFPGLDFRGATLEFNFRVPIFRELLLRLGAIAVSAKSIRNMLGRGPGSAVIIVPGGAAEALDARPGAHELTLKRRNGFFRIALQHGAHLVPVYSFGENELYEQLMPNRPGSMLRTIQEHTQRTLGFSTPYFLGAGSAGSGAAPMNPVPRRHPIITVVGDPIKCDLVDNPSTEQIDALKERYIDALKEIFDRFADQYHPNRAGDLQIVK